MMYNIGAAGQVPGGGLHMTFFLLTWVVWLIVGILMIVWLLQRIMHK